MTSGPGPGASDAPRRALAPGLVDALLGLGVAVVVSLVITADVDGAAPDPTAYLWAVGLGALLLVRRRYPTLVVWLSVLGLFAYYAAGNPPVGVAVPVAAAVFSAAELGRLVPAVAASLVVLAVSVTFRLVEGQDAAYVLGYELAGHVLLLGAAAALGDAVRSRRAAHDGAVRVAALEAERARRAADARVRDERLALARDLHDSIGHATAVVSLHTNVAREAVGRDDAAAAAALDVVAETTSSTLAELRRTVAVLRGRGHGAGVRPHELGDVVDAARRAGLDVASTLALPDDVPSPAAAAAFRIVQESLTNVLRHARGASARVDVRAADGALQIVVSDDGASPPGSSRPGPRIAGDTASDPGIAGGTGAAGGTGIAGMRERAEVLGGTLHAGPASAGAPGYVVRASLPLRAPAREAG